MMKEKGLFIELLTCICRKDRDSLREMLSPAEHITVNHMELSCDEAANRMIDNIALVERESDCYQINLMLSKNAKIHNKFSLLEYLCRLNLDIGCGIWEQHAAIFMLISEARIVSFSFIRTELPSKKYLIKENKSTILLYEKEVRLLESNGNYILWHCNDGVYKERGALKRRIKDLSGRFLSIRSSHCINLDYVKSYRWHEIELLNEKNPIIIPKARYDQVKDFMDRWTSFEKIIIDSRLRI